MRVERYDMRPHCGIALVTYLEINGFKRRLEGHNVTCENKAKANLIEKLEHIERQAREALEDLRTDNVTYKD